MKRRIILYTASAIMAAMLSGCSPRSQEEPLASADGNVRTVQGFDGYYEKPTEPPTETQAQTQPPTETRSQTETETEVETEVKRVEDYDFSDFSVISAAFSGQGGLEGAQYLCETSQDPQTMERTQKITSTDGTMEIVLKADPTSGSTNKSVSVTFTGDNALREAESMIVSLDDGIDETRLEAFETGLYSGTENAPYTGLYDASFANNGSSVSFYMEKFSQAEAATPYWEEMSLDIGAMLESSKFSGMASNGADLFSGIIQGIDFHTVSMSSSKIEEWGRTTDQDGNIVSQTTVFTAEYTSESGTCLVTARGADRTLSFDFQRADASDPVTIMNFADQISHYFVSEKLDLTADLAGGSWSNGACDVVKTDNGFALTIHAASQ